MVIDIPAGRPDADHVYGARPPTADMVVAVYAAPTCPFGRVAGALTDTAARIVSA